MIEANGIECLSCDSVFRRFTAWEDHRDSCEGYQ